MPLPRFRDPFTLKPEEISLERWLLSDEPAEQRLADEALATMGTDDALRVLERILLDESQRRRKGGRVVGAATLVGVAGTVFALDAALGTHLSTGIAGLFGGTMGLFVNGLRPSELMYRCLERIARTGEVRTLPLLLDGWNAFDKRVAGAVRPALVRLLPRLTADDRHLLTEGQWMQVGALTTVRTKPKEAEKRAHEVELARAAIHALGKARPKRGRNHLLSLAYAEPAAEADERQLQQVARNYLAVWDASPSVAAASAAVADLEAEAKRRAERAEAVSPATAAAREWLSAAQAEQQRPQQRLGGTGGGVQ
jgi:hypothetical protein